MNYEIVKRSETKITGISARTGNNSPDMQSVIGNLWKEFYQGDIPNKIVRKTNDFAYGIYSAYEGDTYQVTVGVAVDKIMDHPEFTNVVLPEGTYLKIQVVGDMVKDVALAWEEIWKMDLKRTYTADFEEYVAYDGKNATINIYVAVEDDFAGK